MKRALVLHRYTRSHYLLSLYIHTRAHTQAETDRCSLSPRQSALSCSFEKILVAFLDTFFPEKCFTLFPTSVSARAHKNERLPHRVVVCVCVSF